MRRTVTVLQVLALGSLLAGCGPRLRPAARYSGTSTPPFPGELAEVSRLPSGYTTVGRVASHCTRIEGLREVDGEWLTDIDCSRERVERAIAERAAREGGVLLVGKRCDEILRWQDDERGQRAVHFVCGANVARPTRGARPLPKAMASSTASDVSPPSRYGSPTPEVEYWQLRVDFKPMPGARPAPAVPADGVTDTAELPVGRRWLGDLTVRCALGCSESAARAGLRAAAGRLGGTHVGEAGCSRRGEGWVCVGRVATFERPPDFTSFAR